MGLNVVLEARAMQLLSMQGGVCCGLLIEEEKKGT
jgi:hypothetical protein